jgi:hypothetical protein
MWVWVCIVGMLGAVEATFGSYSPHSDAISVTRDLFCYLDHDHHPRGSFELLQRHFDDVTLRSTLKRKEGLAIGKYGFMQRSSGCSDHIVRYHWDMELLLPLADVVFISFRSPGLVERYYNILHTTQHNTTTTTT